jgi:hypothetical protein
MSSFLMPAIFDSFVHTHGMTPHKAWRVTFVVPFILIASTGIAMLLFGEDTPTGKWSDRHLAVPQITTGVKSDGSSTPEEKFKEPTVTDEELANSSDEGSDRAVIVHARHEIIRSPTLREAMPVIFSLQTLTLMAAYFCSFGGELALNSILGAYYLKNFPTLGQTLSGRWASMFGLLNVITRPAGGFVGDIIYRYTHSLWLILSICWNRSSRRLWIQEDHQASAPQNRIQDTATREKAWRNALNNLTGWLPCSVDYSTCVNESIPRRAFPRTVNASNPTLVGHLGGSYEKQGSVRHRLDPNSMTEDRHMVPAIDLESAE